MLEVINITMDPAIRDVKQLAKRSVSGIDNGMSDFSLKVDD